MYSSTLVPHHPFKHHAGSQDNLLRSVKRSTGTARPGASRPEQRRPGALGPSFPPEPVVARVGWLGPAADPDCDQNSGLGGRGEATQEKAGPTRVWELGGKIRKTKKSPKKAA